MNHFTFFVDLGDLALLAAIFTAIPFVFLLWISRTANQAANRYLSLALVTAVSFMALQRVKEVGIRKTLGASVGNIIFLFSKEFTILIIIAFTIAAPVGYYFMHGWLGDFTYRIRIGADIFLLAIGASVIIAWLTVGYKAFQAALANPVKSLRSE